MAKTLPSYDTYPGDYMAEIISSCSVLAQFVWHRLEMVMHTCEPYGHLAVNNSPMPSEMAARRLGITLDQYKEAIAELKLVGWLTYTEGNMLYSRNLLDQLARRVKAREKKVGQRHPSENEGEGTPSKSPKSTNNQIHNQNAVPSRVPLRVPGDNIPMSRRSPETEKETETGQGKELVSSSSGGAGGDADYRLPDLDEVPTDPGDAAAFAIEQAQAEEEPGHLRYTDAVVYEIALASPSAAALRWTLLSIRFKPWARSPVIEAIRAEAHERQCGTQEAARWILEQVQRVSGYVVAEGGYERFWTQGRFERFFKRNEYRNPETFNRAGGNGNGSGKRRSAGNAEVIRSMLSAGGVPAERGVGDAGEAGGDTRPLPEPNHRARISGEPGRPQPRGAGDGVHQITARNGSLTGTRRASAPIWPEGA